MHVETGNIHTRMSIPQLKFSKPIEKFHVEMWIVYVNSQVNLDVEMWIIYTGISIPLLKVFQHVAKILYGNVESTGHPHR